ncbi:hypothetical protein EAWG_03601 [Escherichia coli TA008]|nr:hypothetical protein EAWG_03601 [Escherichia coli TA008]
MVHVVPLNVLVLKKHQSDAGSRAGNSTVLMVLHGKMTAALLSFD